MKRKATFNKIMICLAMMISLCTINLSSVFAASNTLRISIYSSVNIPTSSASSGLGDSHSWVVIKNLGSSSVKIGTETLSSGQSCTIGLFGNKSKKGIWYNIEANDRTKYLNNGNTVYLTKTVSGTNVVNNIVNTMNNNNYWGLLHNCAHFAVKIFNAPGGTKITTSADPSSLRIRIMEHSGYKTGTNHTDFVNSKKTTKWYSVGAVSKEVTNEEILNGKIIDGDRTILIKDDKLVFFNE